MKSLKKNLFVWCLAVAVSGPLQGQDLTAVETAELGVESLLQTVAESKDFFLTDRDRYFSEIEGVLNTFVDFNAVAEVVMSRFADSRRSCPAGGCRPA